MFQFTHCAMFYRIKARATRLPVAHADYRERAIVYDWASTPNFNAVREMEFLDMN